MPPPRGTHDERIAIASRHVRDGRTIVERQRRLIDDLRRRGISTESSEALLRSFERSQAIFEDDLAWLAASVEGKVNIAPRLALGR